MAEFLFVGSLALVFATLTVIFSVVLGVVTYAIIEEIKGHLIIHKVTKTQREMEQVAKGLQEATTVALFQQVEEYRDGL